MAKNKNNQSVWSSRIKKKKSPLFDKIGSSINVDKRLYKEDINCSLVHVDMLFKQKIISFKVKNKIFYGLNKIKNEILKKKYIFKNEDEDIHMSIERRLHEIIGEDAGFIHTGRSRNDQVVTDLKVWMKESTNLIIKNIKSLQKTFLNLAEKNIYTIMPGFTHLKIAQPISLGHYLMAYIEIFERDKKKFEDNLRSLNENPLGVAALSGTSFNLDRNFTTKRLNFLKPTRNSIDTVSDRDFVVDFIFAASMCSMHISRLSEELIIWNSDAFDLIELNDKLVTGSSIMPQKKNPDPLEYLRGQTGIIYGNLVSILTILKGLPLTYFKDLQDDKKIIFETFDNLKSCILLLNEILKYIKFKKKKMAELAETGFITATDLADYIVKKFNYPFRKSYNITAKLVNYCDMNNKSFKDLKINEIKRIEPKLNDDVLKIFDLKRSVDSKKTLGGTSFDNIKKMLKNYKKELK